MRDLEDASLMIQELLLDYVGNDGCKGRLVYELSLSCEGAQHPTESSSRVVRARNPFDRHQRDSYMTVLPLPYTTRDDGTKKIHAAHLLNSSALGPIRATGCFIKVVADDFDMPVNLCEPYLLVTGGSVKGVDKGVEIVKKFIRLHMDGCSCTF